MAGGAVKCGGQIDQLVEQGAGFHQHSLDSSVASGTGLFEVSMVNSAAAGLAYQPDHDVGILAEQSQQRQLLQPLEGFPENGDALGIEPRRDDPSSDQRGRVPARVR